MIDLIIPMYNCLDTIDKTLNSIYCQDRKDLYKIILVDDCSSCDYTSVLDKYSKSLDITYLRLTQNYGPGIARQYGIDHSNSQYIMFIDADDLLYNDNSIICLYNKICTGLDYVSSLTYNEYSKTTSCNSGDLHGKMYSRDFILKNNIRFNDSRFHEDNAFNSLVLLNNPSKSFIDSIVYIYSYNKKSLTKSNENEEFYRLEIYIKNMKYVIDTASINKCKSELIKEYIERKYSYLSNYYNNLDKDKKEILNKWLEDNNLKVICI